MFKEVEKEGVDARELRVAQLWKEGDFFKKSIRARTDSPRFVFYDGPPFATGLPHYGHLLAGTLKDVVPRYKTMKGYYVERRFGWDCHGLPVENEVEKMHDLAGAPAINAFGIDRFNEACRSIVLRYTEEWKASVNRMGRWVDFDTVWKTMDLPFMESVWWVFSELYKKGLVYEGLKVMPFSAKLGTPLSNFEASENYKEVDDPSLTVKFSLVNDSQTAILAWTTTPWTLVSNLALMVSPEIEYVKIHDHHSGKNFILAKERLVIYFEDETQYSVLNTFKGDELIGLEYLPLFPHFAKRSELGAFRVIEGSEVSTEDGTGVVHCAPAFGESDFHSAQKAGIELVCPVDLNGKYTKEVPEYEGQFVIDANKAIMRRLKEEGKIFRQETIHHRYPFCWRSDTPLIYRAVRTWFVAVEKIKDQLLVSNEQINWMPAYLKEGRFGKWLEGARDWAVSRNRYWGTPIPLWRSEEGDLLCLGSIAELEALTGEKITDLHRHFIDHLSVEKEGKTYKRVPEVFDCWFESGSMPYGQSHYPFENKEIFEKNYPADFIAEGLDQTRGWFYVLTVLSSALFKKPAFKNVIVNGLILAEDGAKMSKRLQNYPDPMHVIAKYGADAVRLYMLDSPAAKADDLRFSERGVELVARQILIPLWNAYSFFITYARIYHYKPTERTEPQAIIDRWLLSLTQSLVEEVDSAMESYDLSRAVKPMVGFVDQLTNWYIRRSRRRFWEEEATKDREQAFETLYHVLLTFCQVAAPFIPFITESIYQNLKSEKMPSSVHLCDFPVVENGLKDLHLEEAMRVVQTAVSLGHGLRKEHKIKVRQPLPLAHLVCADSHQLAFLREQSHLIADELNVKAVELHEDETQFVKLTAKPNFKVLGAKLGSKMKAAKAAIEGMSQAHLARLMEGKNIEIDIEGESVELSSKDVEVSRSVKEGSFAANLDKITIVLDTTLNDELLLEGLAREIVNKVNTMRRDAGLEVTDRILLKLKPSDRLRQCFAVHGEYIQGEILAKTVSFEDLQEGQEWDLNGEMTAIAIAKA